MAGFGLSAPGIPIGCLPSKYYPGITPLTFWHRKSSYCVGSATDWKYVQVDTFVSDDNSDFWSPQRWRSQQAGSFPLTLTRFAQSQFGAKSCTFFYFQFMHVQQSAFFDMVLRDFQTVSVITLFTSWSMNTEFYEWCIFILLFVCFLDGPCGISKMTRAKAGQRTCVSFLNLTQWKIFGRKFSLLKSVWVIDGLLLMCTTCPLMVMSIRISMFHFTDCCLMTIVLIKASEILQFDTLMLGIYFFIFLPDYTTTYSSQVNSALAAITAYSR